MARTRVEYLIAGLAALGLSPTFALAAAQDSKEVEAGEPAPLVLRTNETIRVEVYPGAEAQVIDGPEHETDETSEPVETAGDDEGETVEVNPDEMADMLNSSQQLKQTFTLKRTINGELVETEKRTVTYDRSTPYRETEAGRTTMEKLQAAFDGEALTRTEAFEEAKIDFALADKNRDGLLTEGEFANLVQSWRNNEARQADAPTEEIARQRQYDAFLQEIDPATAEMQTEAYAREKFAFMAGASKVMSLTDYIREYLLDFDSMDDDKDTVLQGDELMRFRALNRGETLEHPILEETMPAATPTP